MTANRTSFRYPDLPKLLALALCLALTASCSSQKGSSRKKSAKSRYQLSGTWKSSTGKVQVIEDVDGGGIRFKNKGEEGWVYCEPVKDRRSWYRVVKATDESGRRKLKSEGLMGGLLIVRGEGRIKVGRSGRTAAIWTKVSESTDYGYAEEREEIQGFDLPEEEEEAGGP